MPDGKDDGFGEIVIMFPISLFKHPFCGVTCQVQFELLQLILTKSVALVGTFGYTVTVFVPEAKTAPVAAQVTLHGKFTVVVEQKFPFDKVIGINISWQFDTVCV